MPKPDKHTQDQRNVLITGGAGFVGSHLTDLLLSRGDRVTVIDDLSTGRRENIPREHQRLTFIEADASEAIDAPRDTPFDQIFHLAASVGVKRVMDHPIESIERNTALTKAVLEHAHKHSTPTLIASSSEVYGKGSKTPFHEDDDCVLGATTMTRWSYACSKMLDEHLALAFSTRRDLPATVVRLFNTVGPRQLADYGMVLPRFVQAALANEDLPVHGDGAQSRCFADVRDVTRVLDDLSRNPDARGVVVNVGADESIAIADLARLVIRTLSSRSEIRLVPYDAVFKQGFEDLRARRPDLTRMRSLTGHAAATPLEQTIRDIAAELSSKQASNSNERGVTA